MSKLMHVEHRQWIEASTVYENVDIFAPCKPDKPVHQIDRKFPACNINSLSAAAESIAFGAAIAEKLAKKHKAGEGITANSNIVGAVTLALGE